MRIVKYEDVPRLFDQILEEVELERATFQVVKNGRPMVRIEPVDAGAGTEADSLRGDAGRAG